MRGKGHAFAAWIDCMRSKARLPIEGDPARAPPWGDEVLQYAPSLLRPRVSPRSRLTSPSRTLYTLCTQPPVRISHNVPCLFAALPRLDAPQCTHSTIVPFFSCALGTRQMHVEPV